MWAISSMLYDNVHKFTVKQVQEILSTQNRLFHSLLNKQNREKKQRVSYKTPRQIKKKFEFSPPFACDCMLFVYNIFFLVICFRFSIKTCTDLFYNKFIYTASSKTTTRITEMETGIALTKFWFSKPNNMGLKSHIPGPARFLLAWQVSSWADRWGRAIHILIWPWLPVSGCRRRLRLPLTLCTLGRAWGGFVTSHGAPGWIKRI